MLEPFLVKGVYEKSKLLTEKSVALSAETYGKESRAYAKSLMAHADYLWATDQGQKANLMNAIALKIVSREEGERSVGAAKVRGLMAHDNYWMVDNEDYDEVSKEAETAMQMIEEKLGKNNFLIVSEKHTLASICIT